MSTEEKMPRLVAELHADSLSPWERAGVRVSATPEWERDGVRVPATPEWERAGVRVSAAPECERAGVRVSATPEWERQGEGACISAKRECSAFHHSYFTLQSSTGGLGYGG